MRLRVSAGPDIAAALGLWAVLLAPGEGDQSGDEGGDEGADACNEQSVAVIGTGSRATGGVPEGSAGAADVDGLAVVAGWEGVAGALPRGGFPAKAA